MPGKSTELAARLERGELPLAGILREAREELGITLTDPIKRGELHFQFLDGYSLFCTVFVASRFDGTPIETEEAVPLWFDLVSFRSTRCGRTTNSGFLRRSKEDLSAVSLSSTEKRC